MQWFDVTHELKVHALDSCKQSIIRHTSISTPNMVPGSLLTFPL